MFQVPAKTQYAIRALAHIARTGGDSAARVALTQNISIKYLEGILNQLKLSGIVISDRGRQGGYRLSKPASEILMIDIVAAMEGELKPVECVDDSSVCSRGAFCMPRKFWQGLRDSVENYLKSVSLSDLAEEPMVSIRATGQNKLQHLNSPDAVDTSASKGSSKSAVVTASISMPVKNLQKTSRLQ